MFALFRWINAFGPWTLALLCLLGRGAALRGSHPGLPPLRVFDLDSGLPQNTILHLSRDGKGRIWVGTQDGAAVYNGHRWQTVDMPDAQRSNIVDVILPTRDGSVWFGRRDGGIARLKEGRWQRFGPEEGLPRGRVTALLETQSPGGVVRMWATVLGAGLLMYQGNGWAPAPGHEQLPSRRPWRLVPIPGQAEAFWVTTEGGLARWEGGHLQKVPGIPPINVNCMIQSQGPGGRTRLWLGSYGDGLYRVDGDEVFHFDAQQGLPSAYITDLLEMPDPEGGSSLWVGSLAGLARLKGGQWTTFGVKQGIKGGSVYRIMAETHTGGARELWIGTGSAGLLRMALGRWTTHDARMGAPEGRIWCVLKTQHGPWAGDLWAGTTQGLFRFRSGAWEAQLHSERMVCLLESLEEGGAPTLWAGGIRGLFRLRGGRWTPVGPAEGFPGGRVNALLETRDAQGVPTIWVGTEQKGLSRLHRGVWTTFPPEKGALGDFITTLGETRNADGGSTLWIGTRDGLSRMGALKPEEVVPAGGLPNNTVQCLLPFPSRGPATHLLLGTFGGGLHRLDLRHASSPLEVFPPAGTGALVSGTIQDLVWDGVGNLFVCTNRGVTRLAPTLGSAWTRQSFNREDGLPSEQVSPKGTCLDPDGQLWVGTSEGLACLDTTQVRADREPKPLVAEGIQADGRDFPGGMTVELPPRSRRVIVQFALLSYFRETETRYRTQLMGLESEPGGWEQAPSREFNNLPPGTYRLRVWARDYAENLSGPLDIPFALLPAWWQTLWFSGALVFLLAAAVWGLIRWRTAAMETRQRILAAEVAARTGELAKANAGLLQEVKVRQAAERTKDEFVAVVSHELRTPLTSIHGALGLALAGVEGPLPEGLARLLELAFRNSTRLQALVNDLLDIQKLEAGVLTLSPTAVALDQVALRAVEGVLGYARKSGVEFVWEAPPPPVRVIGDPARLEQVVTNLLSNACKYSSDGGRVNLRLEAAEGRARLSITNFGEPIPESFRPHIFQKFAQADASSTRHVGGTGLGLAICRAIIDQHQGRIGFDSGPQGTTFWFDLPSTEG